MQQLALALDDAVRPPAARVRAVRGSAYEGGAHTRRTLRWQAPTTTPNDSLLGSLTTLRDRSRQAVRNDGYARSVIDKLVANIVGTGIKPQSVAPDAKFQRDLQKLWLQWTSQSDADGCLDWYGQQAQAVRCWLEAGEAFARLRFRGPSDGLAVPLQIQVLEPEFCPHDFNWLSRRGNRVRAGIEFDAIGRRRAYYFYRVRPGAWSDLETWQKVEVPAENVVHLYEPLRPGQIRGVPHLVAALVRLHELDKYDDAQLLRQQLANLFVAFVTRPPAIDDEATDPLTGLPVDASTEREQLGLEPGIFQQLDPGEDVRFSQPPDAGQTYPDFMRQQLFGIAAATGVPYEVITGDMRGVNDRTVRVILHEFRRRVMAWQHQIVAHQLCEPVWRAWFTRALLSGALAVPPGFDEDPEAWMAVRWVPQGWPYLHPVQDVEAQVRAMRAGLTSRSACVSEQGEDAAAIDEEQAADNERADRLGLRYDSDGRQALGRSAPSGAGGADNEPEPAGATR